MVTSVQLAFALNGVTGRRSYAAEGNPCHDREVFEEVPHKLFLKEAEFDSNLLPQLNAVLEEAGMKPLAEVFLQRR